LLTTVLGAGLGAAVGGAGGSAGAGAAVGAAAGAGGGAALGAGNSSADQAAIQQQYDNAFAQCMYSRGNQVPGFAPVVATARTTAATPDPMVRATQSELNRLGYLREPADGYAGSHTHSAISSFEQANGLPVDGVASPRLLAKLQSTPTNAAAAAPSNWVAPANTSGGPPQTATAAPSGWVAPAKTQ
jgi:peptidoglycan hydrolase-like protein with peptidoglycan-binding domain